MSTHRHMLSDVICQTFEKHVGKHQVRKPEAERRAMVLSFRLPTNHDVEEGYRFVELMIYGPMNYVQVWFKETWDVIPLTDMEDAGEDGEMVPKKGKDYTKGQTEWCCIGDHDSGWRDAVDRFLSDWPRITGFGGRLGEWYASEPPPEGLAELKEKQGYWATPKGSRG